MANMRFPWGTMFFIIGSFVYLIAIIVTIVNPWEKDEIIYKDSKIVCYSDYNDSHYNSHQTYYCRSIATDKVVCEYNYSHGEHDRPPQGCYY